MVVAPRDMKILRTNEVRELKAAYRKKFGESFICFSYADFHGTENIPAAKEYLDALCQAVQADTPTRIESQRYTEFDH